MSNEKTRPVDKQGFKIGKGEISLNSSRKRDFQFTLTLR